MWEILPDSFKKIDNIDIFKKTVKTWHGIIPQGIPSLFFVSKTFFINLMTAIDSANDQNTMRRVI